MSEKTQSANKISPNYAASGVAAETVDAGLSRLADHVRSTWGARDGDGAVRLDLGYFANVVELGGQGIAICTDGIGTKALIAQMMDRYDTVGIDCVAMNVNDLLCVGAEPVSMVDYIAIEEAQPAMLEQLGKGLAEGAKMSGISISGGEIAQMRDVIKGAKPGTGFDLAATAFGKVALDKINVGRGVKPGDLVLGIESSGIHSNGMSLARRAFFELGGFAADQPLEGCRGSIGDELLRPTHIYVTEILEVIRSLPRLRAMVHITGDGLLNLTRVDAPVGFVIDNLPAPPGVFGAIQRLSGAEATEMFQVYNMGIGFCLVVDPQDEAQAIEIILRHGKACTRIGHVVDDPAKKVRIEQYGLIGEGKGFRALD